jgi:RNA polymerase subunit RPABC4/transcription elongation factor Spt4
MAFCSNCGTKMEDGAKFCPSCGTPAGGAVPAPKPATEKVGGIRKCPACGAEVPGMTAVCPSCGHEFSNVQVSSGVKDFFDKIAESDAKAQTNPATNKAAGKGNIIFFIVFILILAILSPILPAFMDFDTGVILMGEALIAVIVGVALFAKKVSFSESENRKKSLIEMFPIPNTKEDLLEFLVLASSQIVPAHGFTHSARKQQEWNRIWAVKCRQVYAKADVALAGNAQSLSTVKNIRTNTEKALAAAQKQLIIAAAVITAAFAAFVITTVVGKSGMGITVPESVVIAPENITVTGSLSGHIRAAGEGLTMTASDGGTSFAITAELEAVDDLQPFVREQVAEFAQVKGWPLEKCIYTMDTTWMTLDGGYESVGRDLLSELVEKGGLRTGRIYSAGLSKGSTAEKKKWVLEWMTKETITLRLYVYYRVEYTPPGSTEKLRESITIR